MFNRLFSKLKSYMGFKANSLKIKDEVVSPPGEATSVIPKVPKGIHLDKLETEVLLHTIKSSTFKGEMVEVIYILATKLKNNLKQFE